LAHNHRRKIFTEDNEENEDLLKSPNTPNDAKTSTDF